MENEQRATRYGDVADCMLHFAVPGHMMCVYGWGGQVAERFQRAKPGAVVQFSALIVKPQEEDPVKRRGTFPYKLLFNALSGMQILRPASRGGCNGDKYEGDVEGRRGGRWESGGMRGRRGGKSE